MPSSPANSRKKFAFSVVIKIFVGRPVLVFCRGEDGPVSESQNVAGEIVFGLKRVWQLDKIQDLPY
jgi:hypothetical protein